MKTKNLIKAAVIEPDAEQREKLSVLIGDTHGLVCAGRYETPEAALRGFADDAPPDIVLCGGGFKFTTADEKKIVKQLREKHRHLPILILNFYRRGDSSFEDSKKMSGGCLLKLTAPVEILERRTAHDQTKAFLDLIGGRATNSKDGKDLPEGLADALTPHETRLLKLIVDGHNYTTSAQVLKVSYNTVKFHMRRIYQKLDVNSKSAAVAKALRCRLTE